MDFYKIREQRNRNGVLEIFPDFCTKNSKDLMIRGKSFYAVWNKHTNLWSTDEYDIQQLIDEELYEYAEEKQSQGHECSVKSMLSFDSGSWVKFKKFLQSMADNYKSLNDHILFSDAEVTRGDYASKTLPYSLSDGRIDSYSEIMDTLYDPEDRQKLEWAIGSIIKGDSRFIQKFIVLYGEGGSGKSTFLNILQKVFEGYYSMFDAKALVGSNNSFATEVFKNNPLVAIQHDGDLSKIEDNTKLNSIISHEEMTMNEKYKPQYTARTNCFLFMGTNSPVKITNAYSGIIRRLIDVRPSGRLIEPKRYDLLMTQMEFEVGAIANHCLKVYEKLGKNFYNGYRATNMMLQTNVFYNFVEENYILFKKQDNTSLKQAWELYKEYCEMAAVQFKLPRHVFREELKPYFKEFYDDFRDGDNRHIRNYYAGFKTEKIDGYKEEPKESQTVDIETEQNTLMLTEDISLFDKLAATYVAQYANAEDTPMGSWDRCKTTLSDLDTSKVHYVRPPLNHIVIDFDIKDETGKKSKKLNLEAAALWPSTYAEFSKGGNGVHLHYIYDGDVTTLSRVYDENIEIKVFTGLMSLRRRLTKCNNVEIAHISSGLPLKDKVGKMINLNNVRTEQGLRILIQKNLNKEYHASTKSSVDFIKKILDDAYKSELRYDITDMRGKVLQFAMGSTNSSDICVKNVNVMKFKSQHEEIVGIPEIPITTTAEPEIVFFDVEIFPNLFIVCFKQQGKDKIVNRMINPTPQQIGELLKFRLVGFNNRPYDNHMIYARFIGYDIPELYLLSQKLVGKVNNGTFREAYNLSYTDVYDFSTKKQSLKKWEIELGIKHQEFPYHWDEPVPKDKWVLAADYCCNDVLATEAVFDKCVADYTARLILADLAGGTPNNTTNQLTTKLIFGNNKNPKLNYVDLEEEFPGYKYTQFEDGTWHNMYRGVDIGFGGYVKATPNMYGSTDLYDIESMHPRSAIVMKYFGEYTKNFEEIVDIRLGIKHGNIDDIINMMAGRLAKYLVDESLTEGLSYALKIAINSVYGLTSAKFDNPFRDKRNVNNIVALRGALFMKTLEDELINKGYIVAHIKTDSIKIPNADPEVKQFCMDFAKKYGYTFDHEATYSKFCLVNDAVYIAKYGWAQKAKKINTWTATGAQFAHPYLFKTLFSKEPIVFDDLCEIKTVTSPAAMYLDFNENLPDVFHYEIERDKLIKKLSVDISSEEIKNIEQRLIELDNLITEGHNYIFIGKIGKFCPIIPGGGGANLYRKKDEKYHAVTGTKGYRWMESVMVETLNKQVNIDYSYFNNLVDTAVDDISKFGDFEWFVA